MQYKNDWENAKKRFESWWNGEIIDRIVVLVFAPQDNIKIKSSWSEWDLIHNLDHPDCVIDNFELHCKNTYFGGEAFPNLWVNFGPGVLSAYIGSTPVVSEDTVWFEDPKNWDDIFSALQFNADNNWWNYTKSITSAITNRMDNKFLIGMTDLGGNLDVLASLRGTQNLLIDLIENPEKVKRALSDINQLWFRYFNELYRIMQPKMEGTTNWMSLWSRKIWYPLQSDFSAMISPKQFEEFVAPFLLEQSEWLEQSIYHWDGPGEIPHLDILLNIPKLHGIQWVPGSGNPGVGSPKWFPLYKKIQEKKKLLVLLDMKKEDIENVLNELSPEGLLISVSCNSKSEGEDLLKKDREMDEKEEFLKESILIFYILF